MLLSKLRHPERIRPRGIHLARERGGRVQHLPAATPRRTIVRTDEICTGFGHNPRTIVRTDEIYTRLGHCRRRIVGTDETDAPRGSPDRREQLTDAEIATALMHWYKRRLMHRLDRRDHRQEQRPSTTLNNDSRPDDREWVKPATIQREPVSKRRTVRDWDGPPGSPGRESALDVVSTGSTNRGAEWSRQARPTGGRSGLDRLDQRGRSGLDRLDQPGTRTVCTSDGARHTHVRRAANSHGAEWSRQVADRATVIDDLTSAGPRCCRPRLRFAPGCAAAGRTEPRPLSSR